MRDAVRIVRGWGFAVGASIGLAVLCDWLLYQRVIGWSAGLLLLAALSVVVIHAGGMLRRREGLLSVLLVMGVAPAYFEQPSVLAGAMAALLLGICAMVGRGNWSGRVLVWARRWLVLLVRGPLQGPLDVALSGRWLWRHPRKRGGPIVWRVARWIVPLGVGLVFAGLFALANPVLGTWARTGWDRVATLLAWLPDLLAPQRVVLWMVVGMAAYALLRYRQAPWARGGGLEAAPIAGAGLGAGLVVRSLLVLNAVFGLQTALDIVYLWGGAELPHHLTYAQYAHRGSVHAGGYGAVGGAACSGLLSPGRPGGTILRSAASGVPVDRAECVSDGLDDLAVVAVCRCVQPHALADRGDDLGGDGGRGVRMDRGQDRGGEVECVAVPCECGDASGGAVCLRVLQLWWMDRGLQRAALLGGEWRRGAVGCGVPA